MPGIPAVSAIVEEGGVVPDIYSNKAWMSSNQPMDEQLDANKDIELEYNKNF